MRIACAALALLISPPAVAQAAQADSGWVAMSLDAGGVPAFTARVNGVETMALLDTGSSDVLIDRQTAARLGLKGTRATRVNAPGGSGVAATQAVGAVALEIGAARIALPRAQLSDLSGVNAAKGTRFGVVVGTAAFGRRVLEIDFTRMRFRLSAAAPAPRSALPFAIVRGVPVAALRVGDVTRRVMIDTGKDGDLAVAARAFAALAQDARETSLGRMGLGGVSVARLAVVPALAFGTARLRDVELQGESGDGLTAVLDVDAIAGIRLLQRFNLRLDYGRRTLSLSPSGRTATSAARSTSGLQVVYGADSAQVAHVMRNGPAALAGWKPQERICSIDGAPIRIVAGSSTLRTWGTGPAGRTVSFGMCDGQRRRLVLADFY